MIRYHPYKGIKRRLLIDVLAKLPYTPVLHVQTVMLVALMVLVLKYISVLEPWRVAAWQTVGSVLKEMADWALSGAQ